MLTQELTSERLILRRTTEADAPLCFRIWLDPEMGRYLSDPPRAQASESYLNFAKGIDTDSSWYPFVVFSRETGDFIGTCSAVPTAPTCWDLGYAVHRRYWRQGYATEMLRRLISFGAQHGVHSFTADVAQENIASNALLNKLGFRATAAGSFQKTGTDLVYPNYLYQLVVR